METIATILLSDEEPEQTPCPPSGTAFTSGDKVAIMRDEDGTYAFCRFGVGADGNAYEGDDEDGYGTIEQVLEAVAYEAFTRADTRAWHEAALTPRLDRFIDLCRSLIPDFDRIEVWGMADPRRGEEPLTVRVY